MLLSDVSVKRPVFATVLSLLLVIFGLLAFDKLPLREYPDVNPPVVSIRTTYVGASAEVVETKITQVIEDIISGIEDVKTLESKSQDGISTITIEFGLNRDVDDAAADVRDRVSRVLGNLPKEADPPEITKVDANTQEIIWFRLTSDTKNALELTDYAQRFLVDRFAVVNGVARVRIGGERRYAMRIWLDRKQLAARSLTVGDIEVALQRENVELPSGRLESYKREFTIRTQRSYNNPEDFSKLVIKRDNEGRLIRLADVAEVKEEASDSRTELRSNGMPAVGIGIAKQSRANTLEVARGAKAEMERALSTLPQGVEMSIAFDSSLFIEAAIEEVYMTFVITIVLVIIVIFIFLGNLRATVIPTITIPVSLVSAFIVLYWCGFSVNLLTLLALVLAIGLVVDDSIVVLENIFKKVEAGMEPLAAAFLGTRQVAFAVVATTVVLIAVFVPISFMEGEVGRLFTEFAFALAGAVGFSGFISLTFSPMLASKVLKTRSHGKPGGLSSAVERVMEAVIRPYRSSLQWCLGRQRFFIVLSALSIPFIFLLLKVIPKEYEPTEDRGMLFVAFTGPEGASLEYMKMYSREIEADLQALTDKKEARQTLVFIPMGFSSSGSVNSGMAIVLLEPWDMRKRGAKEIVGETFGLVAKHEGLSAIPILPKGLSGGRFSQPIEFVIQGSSYEELVQWRDIYLDKIKNYPGLVNVDYDYKETKPQYLVEVDKSRAASLGISSEVIGRTLETMLGSRKVTTYIDRGEEYDVILQSKPEDRRSVIDLDNIYVRSSLSSTLVPLSNLVVLKESAASPALNRFNRLRAITISANIGPGYNQSQVLDYMEQAFAESLPNSARFDYKGQSRTFKESGTSFVFAFFLAIGVIYLVLAAQFESFVHPLVILTTVPLAILGALLGLFFWGITLNIYSEIAILMLIGLAAKNGILIVEFTNQLRDEGKEFVEALIEACSIRFRPILMTSFAAAIGALPLVLATGAGAESRMSMGVVIFVGVIFSTFLTLYIVPVFYQVLARHTLSPETVANELNKQLERLNALKEADR